MRAQIIFVMLFTMFASVAMAQEQKPEKNFYMSFTAETRAGSTFARRDNNFSMMDIEASYGFHFNDRWSVHIPLAASTGLFHNSKTFTEQGYLGISAEYKVVQSQNWCLAIAPKVQSTLGGKWGAMAYDLGVKFEFNRGPYIGIGIRYIDTYKSSISNKCCIYANFGFRINSPK